ncbi:hypothetical protein CTI14_61695, partial [Methylobacterium radiotolerans]
IAEHLLGSGVLAVVAMGLFVGFNAPRTDYTTRQQEAPLWLSADLLLESFVVRLHRPPVPAGAQRSRSTCSAPASSPSWPWGCSSASTPRAPTTRPG